MQDISDDTGMIAFIFDSERELSNEAKLVDDIGDKLQVLAALSDIYPNLTVHTPVKKQHTDSYQQSLPVVTVVNATVETANEWIACGCGMNEGATEGTVEQQAYLSTLQRFSRKGYFKELDNSMSIEEKIAFFEGLLLEGFSRHDDLFMLCQVMEQAKIEKRFDDLMNLAPLVVPTILRHIQTQQNLARVQDPHYDEFIA